MPCIAIGPEDEEEDQSPSKVMWATSCAVSSGAQPAAQNDAESLTASPWRNKRIIFLEIDGVLNTRPDPRMITVERIPCLQLRRLLEASEAEIVLISGWRRHHEYIAEVLKNFGVLSENRRELERAPWNANPERRDLEILQWVNAHRDIATWVVLDARDLLRFPSAQRLHGHTIQVNPIEGLTGDVVVEALRILACDGAGPRGSQPSTARDFATPSQEAVSSQAIKASLQSDLAIAQPTAGGSQAQAASSLQAVENDLAASMRAAFSWDSDLAGKMESLLGSLPRAGDGTDALAASSARQDIQFPKSDSSRAEFEAVRIAAQEKFKQASPA